MKWVTNGHIAVISHESQQEPFRSYKRDKKANLYATAHKGDELCARQEVDHHLWHNVTDQHEVHEGELTEEEVHGCVKSRICEDEEDEEAIPAEGHCEDSRNCREEDEVSQTLGKDAQEDEAICARLVQPHLHSFVGVPGHSRTWTKNFGIIGISLLTSALHIFIQLCCLSLMRPEQHKLWDIE